MGVVVSQGDERYICKLFAEKVREHQLQSWGSPSGGRLRNTNLVMEVPAFLATKQLKLCCPVLKLVRPLGGSFFPPPSPPFHPPFLSFCSSPFSPSLNIVQDPVGILAALDA